MFLQLFVVWVLFQLSELRSVLFAFPVNFSVLECFLDQFWFWENECFFGRIFLFFNGVEIEFFIFLFQSQSWFFGVKWGLEMLVSKCSVFIDYCYNFF